MQFYQNLPDFEFPPEFGDVNEYFRHLVVEGLAKRYPKENETKGEAWGTIKKRADYEMDLIIQLNFVNYFLIVSDYINWAKNHGMFIGPGFGSIGGSIVAYALKITSIDPLQYNLLFERFLNPERLSPADIDVDVGNEERDKVIEYIKEKYSQERVGHMLEMPFIFPAGMDIYPVSLVICKSSLHDFVQVTKDKKTGVNTVQCSFYELEKCGLTTFDFLGLKILDVIKHTVELIHKLNGDYSGFCIEDIPKNDLRTFTLFGEGKADSVFLFDSAKINEICLKAKPCQFTDLIALHALNFIGDIIHIDRFIELKNGLKNIVYPDPCMEDILKETYGIIVYQEQIMLIIQRITGYSLGAADITRRYLMKRHIENEKKKFITAALSHGFEQKHAMDLFDLITSSAPLAYCKSFAIAFTLKAYQAAYLKAHFPEQYKTAYCKYLGEVVE